MSKTAKHKESGLLPVKQRRDFFSNLYILLNNGIELFDALQLANEGNSKSKIPYRFLAQKLSEGFSFANALKLSGMYSTVEINCINIGESTGMLKEIVLNLSEYYEQTIKLKNSVTQALIYPSIVLLTACASVVFMVLFVVPMFEQIFSRSNMELPILTNYILIISRFVLDNIRTILFVLVILMIVLGFRWRKVKNEGTLLDGVSNIPIIGKIVFNFELSKVCLFTSFLLKSDVALQEVLSFAEEASSIKQIKKVFGDSKKEIRKGNTLYTGISKHSVFKPFELSIIHSCEETNELSTGFLNIHRLYNERAQKSSDNLKSMFEPILIIFVGSLVAVILISMYLPIFKMGTALG